MWERKTETKGLVGWRSQGGNKSKKGGMQDSGKEKKSISSAQMKLQDMRYKTCGGISGEEKDSKSAREKEKRGGKRSASKRMSRKGRLI